jgi:hypothetical protein
MGNKLRSTEKCLMRLADKGYTSLKLNVQNMDDDITISEEELNTWSTHGKFPNSLQENHVDENSSPLWLSAGCICTGTVFYFYSILLFCSIDPYSMGSSPKTGYRTRQEIA